MSQDPGLGQGWVAGSPGRNAVSTHSRWGGGKGHFRAQAHKLVTGGVKVGGISGVSKCRLHAHSYPVVAARDAQWLRPQ